MSLGSRGTYGQLILNVPKGEYKIVVSSNVSGDIRVGVNCNQNVPILEVNEVNPGKQEEQVFAFDVIEAE